MQLKNNNADKKQHNTKERRPQIDKHATLDRFTTAGIRISGWCRSRGIDRGRFYNVINNKAFLRRDCYEGQKVLDTLKQEGLLVLAEDQPND